MPSPSSINYELVELKDQDAINFTRTQNSAAWKGQLTADQYIERERVLGKTKICNSQTSQLKVFMLRDKSDPSLKLSSIELLVRKAWIYKHIDGKVQRKDVLCGCIGGVFTYPDHRGKGLAQIMVDKLVQFAKDDILGSDGFIFLYSEVGEYYTRNGFKSFEVPLLKVPFSTGGATAVASNGSFDVSLLKYHDFGQVLEFHNKQFDAELTSKCAADHKDRVAINPTSDIVDWFHIRAKFISTKVFYKHDIDFSDMSLAQVNEHFHQIKPDIFGLKLTENGTLVGSIIWTYEFNKDTNYITVLKIVTDNSSAHSRDDLCKELILRLKQYIETPTDETLFFLFSNLVVWQSEISDNTVQWLTNEHKGVPNNSNSSRSAILINNVDDDKKLQSGDLLWEGNDKLPWF